MTLVPPDPAQLHPAFAHALQPVARIRPFPSDLDESWQPLVQENASVNPCPSAVYAIL